MRAIQLHWRAGLSSGKVEVGRWVGLGVLLVSSMQIYKTIINKNNFLGTNTLITQAHSYW